MEPSYAYTQLLITSCVQALGNGQLEPPPCHARKDVFSNAQRMDRFACLKSAFFSYC